MAKGDGALSPLVGSVAPRAQLFEIAQVTSAIGAGMTFKSLAVSLGASTTDLWVWIREDPTRMAAYEAACEAREHTRIDQAHDLADRVVEGDLDPKRADLKIKLSQWSASKTKPYQDRKTVEHQHTVKLDAADLAARLEQLMQVANQRAALTIDHETITHDVVQTLP